MTNRIISFEEALRGSEELLLDLEESGPSTERLEMLSDMLNSQQSCRGFFVFFLTGDSKLADEPADYMLAALKASEHVPELLAKNLVMSVTMQITHQRSGDLQNAEGSETVARRSAELIRKMQSPEVRTKLVEMRSSISSKAGVFADFLRRWAYDDEQLRAANSAIEKLL